jgi:hypothetical protein
MNQTIMQYWNTLGKMDLSIKDDCNYINVTNCVTSIRHGDSLSNPDPLNLLSDIQIDVEDIKNLVSKLENNKSPGIDTITNELIKNGGDGICVALVKLFNRLLEFEKSPDKWNKGIIVPIFKKGNKNDLNNYRGITLTSCISKMFNRLISNCISSFIEENNILSEIQGGFRKDHRCEDHVFTLKSITAARLAEKKSTYLAFLDFRKAFDTVWRDGLLSVAWNIGIRGKIWNILDSLYNNVFCNVKFGDIVTDYFEVDEGLKQGCVLSPILFCIYINELAKMLENNNVGINVCNVKISCLFWADDVVLIADNEQDLIHMLNTAAEFSKKWKMHFNHSKSNVLVVGKRVNKNKLWKLGDDFINEVDSYKYLGIHINRNLSEQNHLNEVISKGNRLIGYIKSIY